LALGAIAKVRALSPVQPDRPPTYTTVRQRRRVERPVAPRFAGAFFFLTQSATEERFFLEKERGFIELSKMFTFFQISEIGNKDTDYQMKHQSILSSCRFLMKNLY
jgi:hypothetical protein